MTPEKMKIIRMSALGIFILSMIGYMAFDAMSTPPKTPPIAPSVEESEVISTQEMPITPITSIDEGEVSEIDESEVKLPPTVSTEPNEVVRVVTYQPTHKATQVIEALEDTYISEVNKKKLAAQIAEKIEKQTLESMSIEVLQSSTPASTEQAQTSYSLMDGLTVKSIVVTPKRTAAWLNVNGEEIPVEMGVWVGNYRVVNITKDFVRFNDKQGQGFTKYVPSFVATPIPGQTNE